MSDQAKDTVQEHMHHDEDIAQRLISFGKDLEIHPLKVIAQRRVQMVINQ